MANTNLDESVQLADILFPDIPVGRAAEILAASKPRALPEGACVTRFAPSPTGFLHIGGVYAALISERIAHQTKGVFILRIEDTDKQREVEGAIKIIAQGLGRFGISPDEGVLPDLSEAGAYGPYLQSERLDLYRVFLKELVARGGAYPCFCSTEELDIARETQELQKVKTGYYGRWAKHRNISAAEVAERLARGETYVVRVKSRGADGEKLQFTDLVKGSLSLSVNDQDSILLKSDGYPTYHWAHCVDDALMQTTHVIRGDEWLSSAPLHVELFELMGWTIPQYAHIAPIVKIDETGTKRKLSKRKDPEANVEFYFKEGYPISAVTEYLLNLANSNFEDWRRENQNAPSEKFVVRLDKGSVSGALFDFVKLADVSKEIVARMTANEVYSAVLAWARENDSEFVLWLEKNSDYAQKIFNIEREGEKRRKDIAKWSDARNSIEYFITAPTEFVLSEKVSAADARAILEKVSEVINVEDTADVWLTKFRALAVELGFAPDTKTFKTNPTAFKGTLGDVAGVLRVALTGRTNTPDLHQMMQVFGMDEVHARIDRAIAKLG
ncbi:MAG: glutamate--tRNA ligase [Candidatus Magasanikbacteria bacterium]|nr:glutamate--tRNA ligase [Candidatus Magasanikbacteria bacterium]